MMQAALDTSRGAALALKHGSDILYAGHLEAQGRRSDAELVPWLLRTIENCGIAIRDIRRWTVGLGPGSFSGVRVGISLVRGICAGSGAACRGLPGSLALARAAVAGLNEGACVGVLHDGRRGQLILTVYRLAAKAALVPAGEARVIDPDLLVASRECGDILVTVQPEEVLPLLAESARKRVTILPALDARLLLDPPGRPWPDSPAEADLEPIYVRPAVFVRPREPRRVPGSSAAPGASE